MKYKLVLTFCFLISMFFTRAQTGALRINANIVLPKDTAVSKALIASLNDFLTAARRPNEENLFIWDAERIETYILLDEINGIEKSGRYKDDLFYKPYLMNAAPLKDSEYFLQISYIGMHDDIPLLRACFELVAHRHNSSFLFSSPLIRNTKGWKKEEIGRNVFHYQASLNKASAKRYTRLAASFDSKLNSKNKVSEFYCCENIIELQKLIGISYKSDYNGKAESMWASKLGNKKLIVAGNNNASFNEFDEHDLWHERLGLVIPRSQVNNPVDEGCAYLYGGSWGLPWKDIFTAFYRQIAADKQVNWCAVKESPVFFKTKGIDNSADYIINALLVQKIEREKGFAGVWELLNCGKAEQGNKNYYTALERLTGITKADYNAKGWELIAAEKKKLKL